MQNRMAAVVKVNAYVNAFPDHNFMSRILAPPSAPVDSTVHPQWLLKKGPTPDRPQVQPGKPEDDEAFRRIRCPLCDWQPTASSRWHCDSSETPEPPFPGCGTVWNTFSTRGRCPGCRHQWRWTSCLRCEGWSLHEDWYDVHKPS
jgi:hypothetical protein